jgi:tetratricopeptide (TPR) repeat protein
MRAVAVDSLAVLLAMAFSLASPCASLAKVKAWQGTVTIPTYGWEEDVNPKLWALEGQVKFATTVKGSIVYPYPMQDHLYRTKEERTYKALFLENEYLKVTCLPELGGRLHSVLDKTKAEQMFHFNNVIKPGMIAMRGAWISGGVEWNAGPQGHTVTCVSPVDAIAGRNSDGSAYIEISNLEKSQRTQWTVRVTLHPGKAYIDEQIRLFNPIDAVSPYYFWNCTAFVNRPGTRFIYPMTLGTDHNAAQFFSWPIHEGKDLSWLKNYEIWASIFSVDCTFDFFGAYDVDMDRGIVQVANHRQLSGKKAWTWGTWDFGLVSQKNLTDDDGPYIEVQSGPLPTQSDYGMLLPRQEVSWQELWYPVHGLAPDQVGGGFEYATKDIAVQTSRQDDTLQLRIIATAEFPGATCILSQDERELIRTSLDLSPANPQVVTLHPAPKSAVDVSIKAKNGDLLASFATPLQIPRISPPERPEFMTKSDEKLSVEEMYLKGRKSDLATNRNSARRYYEKALSQDGQYAPALRDLAVLDFEAGLYETVIERLKKALLRDPDDGLSWFFLGASYLKLKDESEALNSAYHAIRCSGTTSLGYDLAGRAYMQLRDYIKAIDAFEKAVLLNPHDARARDHLLLALYAAGKTDSAYKRAKGVIAQDPTDLVPRALMALQNKRQMDHFVRQVRDFVGEVDFEMMETALVFAELQLAKEAEQLLSAVCVESVPQGQLSPLPLYYLAYFAALQGDKKIAQAYLRQAAKTYRDYAFPSQPEAVAIFKYALEENPGDAYAHLHLGNLYAHLGRLDESAKHWRKASEPVLSTGSIFAGASIAFRNLGLYAWAVEEDLAKAEQLYRKAIAARPKDQTLYRDLADILLAANNRPGAIRVLESTQYDKTRRSDVAIMLAQAYLDEHKYTEAITLLESTPYFVNWEGQTITWDIFHKAHIERGRQRFEEGKFDAALQDFQAALTYPENIGVGRSNRPQEAYAQYWRGKALQALGRIEEARLAWQQGEAGSEGTDQQNKHRQLCKEALSKLSG